jgi:5S rRNA maturation endonuclease (ribonuclease M5)|tara:strand:+ start:431 stop:2086 length:1656 start_codon:yes stop_codon:yes gene_type:complete
MNKSKGTTAYKTNCTDCGSSNAKQVFNKEDGTQDAFCYACDKYDPMGNHTTVTKNYKEYTQTMTMPDVSKLKSLEIPDRMISKDTVEYYGVRLALSEVDGTTITEHYYPDHNNGELIGYEVRDCVSKNFKAIGNRKGSFDLWGQSLAPLARKLFITEGRLDAMSLHQVIIDNTPAKYAQYKPAVVSLTRGVSSAVKDILHNKEFISKYEEVILVLDNDEAGKKATKDILKLLPMAKTAILSEKDASDMLVKGKSKELYQAAVWNSQVVRQGEVVDVSDFIEKAMEKPQMGLSFPWPSITKLCFGVRPHTLLVIGAAPKIGKSDFCYQLVHHLVYNEKVKVGIFDLENSPVKTAKKIASKEAKLDFTRPDKVYSDDLLRNTLTSLDGKVRFYDRSGSRDWEDIRVAIEEMHLLDGINTFIIDPLTALVSRLDSSSANDKLNEICTDMADLVSNYPINIFCFSHVNPKPKSSKSHEQGGKVLSGEFTGSRAMEKWFHYGIGISRDRSEDCPAEEKNMSRFTLLFDREYGQSGGCDVYFDEDTVTYLEPNRWGK